MPLRKGGSINYVDRILMIFDPPPPSLKHINHMSSPLFSEEESLLCVCPA